MSYANVRDTHVERRISNAKLGMWLYLATEIMLFTGLIGAFLNMKWRSPVGANHILNIPTTAVNTFVLIVSSTAAVLALAAVQDGKLGRMRLFMYVTWALGVAFLSVQIREYILLWNDGFTPAGSLFGGAFYTLTGFHGFHVFVGLLWLSGLIVLAWRGRLTVEHSMWVEVFGLYWHLVDIVWIILFTIVYLI